jgi:hypothetical protein
MTSTATVAPATKNEPKGLGGWMIFPTIGTVITPLLYLGGFFQVARVMTQETYSTPLGVFLTFELVVHIAFAVLAAYTATLLFRRSKDYPRWFIGILAGSTGFLLFDSVIWSIVLNVPLGASETKDLVQSIGGCAIWIPYMMRSRRVANTFVE